MDRDHRYEPTTVKYPAKMLPQINRSPARALIPILLKIDDALTLKCNVLPAGRFLQGSPFYQRRYQDEFPHEVVLTKSFAMSEVPITQEIFEAVMGKNPSLNKAPRFPVDAVAFADIMEFCRIVSQKNGVTVRLPTDAEWEYAARVGTSNPCFTEKYKDQISETGGRPKGAPVKSMKPNAWGLYDMLSGGWHVTGDYKSDNVRVKEVDPHGPVADRQTRSRRRDRALAQDARRPALRSYSPEYPWCRNTEGHAVGRRIRHIPGRRRALNNFARPPARCSVRRSIRPFLGQLAAQASDLVLGDDAELRAEDRGALEPAVGLDEGHVHLDQDRAGLEREAADLGVAHAAFVGLGRLARSVWCPSCAKGFQRIGEAPAPWRTPDRCARRSRSIRAIARPRPGWSPRSRCGRGAGRARGNTTCSGRASACGGLMPDRPEVVVLQEPGLKPHVGDLDFLLVGARGFLAEVDLFEVGVDDEPDVGDPDRRAGDLHVAHLDDVGRRDRVAKQVVECAIRAGHFAQGRALGGLILAVDQAGCGSVDLLAADFEALVEHLAVDRVLRVGRLDLSLARQQDLPARIALVIMGGVLPNVMMLRTSLPATRVDSKEELT